MRKVIVLTGGGSGGHLTPVISVAEALRKQAPEYSLVYIGQKGDSLGDIMHEHPVFNHVYTVKAGKFRRYHGQGIKQLLDLKTFLLNVRDLFYVFVGFVQALFLLAKLKPRVLFCKGGFVGVPVGLAAAIMRIPYVTHDSDAIPGLANKIIGRWAKVHAVAMAKEQYNYPAHKTITVGVPVQTQFKRKTTDSQRAARQKLGILQRDWVLFVIGGGQGAERVNQAVIEAVPALFKKIPNLYILHVAGRRGEDSVRQAYDNLPDNLRTRVSVFGFTKDVATLGEASDVAITRAGATNLAEFALQGMACVIVPNPLLTGGHQLKNAQAYADANAALILSEQNLGSLAEMVVLLHDNKQKQNELSENITKFANKQAAQSLAGVLLTAVRK